MCVMPEKVCTNSIGKGTEQGRFVQQLGKRGNWQIWGGKKKKNTTKVWEKN